MRKCFIYYSKFDEVNEIRLSCGLKMYCVKRDNYTIIFPYSWTIGGWICQWINNFVKIILFIETEITNKVDGKTIEGKPFCQIQLILKPSEYKKRLLNFIFTLGKS